MDISEYGTSPHVDPLMQELEEFGLFKHVVELEAYGMTVVPKELMGVDDDFVSRLRDAILRTCESVMALASTITRSPLPTRRRLESHGRCYRKTTHLLKPPRTHACLRSYAGFAARAPY